MRNNTPVTWAKSLLVLTPVMLATLVMTVSSWQARLRHIDKQQHALPLQKQQPAAYQLMDTPTWDNLKPIAKLPIIDAQPAPTTPSDTHTATNVSDDHTQVDEQPEITQEAIEQAIEQAKHGHAQRHTDSASQLEQSDNALRHLDMSKLSPALQSRVQAALKGERHERQQGTSRDALDIRQHHAEFAGQLPPLNFQSHVYTTDVVRRWIKVNGVEYRQGDKIGKNIQLLTIKPQSVVLKFKQTLIAIPALYDWQG